MVASHRGVDSVNAVPMIFKCSELQEKGHFHFVDRRAVNIPVWSVYHVGSYEPLIYCISIKIDLPPTYLQER